MGPSWPGLEKTPLDFKCPLYFSVALVSGGATIQQSSFYGLTSGLPSRYTQVSLLCLSRNAKLLLLSPQAVMTGESLAGLVACIARSVIYCPSFTTHCLKLISSM